MPALTLLSSRFEGFDERIVEHLATDAISVGPYVLSNGDLPAMVAPRRGRAAAARARSPRARASSRASPPSSAAALEYPHYTRPAEFRGWPVPDVLLSGDHARDRRLAAGACDVSDDWDWNRSEMRRRRRVDANGTTRSRRHERRAAERLAGTTHARAAEPRTSPSDWPTPGAPWQRPEYSDHARRSGSRRTTASTAATATRATSADADSRTVPAQPRSARPPLPGPAAQRAGHARLDPHHRRRDPDRARAQAWVVNPYRIPSSSMEPTLNCAKARAPAASATRATACSRAASVSTSARPVARRHRRLQHAERGRDRVRRRRHVREARDRPAGRASCTRTSTATS